MMKHVGLSSAVYGEVRYFETLPGEEEEKR